MALQGPLDLLAAAGTLFLLPAAAATAITYQRGQRITALRLAGSVTGLCSTIALFVLAPAGSQSLGSHVCKFGYGTFGEVWVKVEPPHRYDKRPEYRVDLKYGAFRANWRGDIGEEGRYLTFRELNAFDNHTLEVKVAPEAKLSCGSSAIDTDDDKSEVDGWKRRSG